VFHCRAWRSEIPSHILNRATLNVLEFVASIVGPWIDLLEENFPEFSCIWSQTYSTIVDGWMNKSSFHDACSVHFKGPIYTDQSEIPTRQRIDPRGHEQDRRDSYSGYRSLRRRSHNSSSPILNTFLYSFLQLQNKNFWTKSAHG
jgi:hypothetical protein